MGGYVLKNGENAGSVKDFLASIEDDQKRKDCKKIASMMAKLSGKRAKMWGKTMVGYGKYEYTYASGHSGEFFRLGFSPRANAITLYIMSGFTKYDSLMNKLGKYKTGKSCLYIKKLEDIDEKVLEKLIIESLKFMEKTYGPEQ